jgi:hypothetical protein
MREWLNRADSKSVKFFLGFVGSNPTLSVPSIFNFYGRDDREAEGARLESVCTCKGTVGSNPTLSVSPLAVIIRLYAIHGYPTPSGPEGSSGK